MKTWIRQADWVVGWDSARSSHCYQRNVDVVFDEGGISFVGKTYDGEADTIVDGNGKMVMPGLIDLHAHPSTEPAQKGIREEHVVPSMYMSSLYQRSAVFRLDAEGKQAAIQMAYAELLRSGVTTVADLSFPFEGWLDVVAGTGMRTYVAPGYASARWRMESEHRLGFEWDEAAGERDLEAALELIGQAEKQPRLSGMLYPAQIDTCTQSLLEASMQLSTERQLPITTHIAQSVPEFQEMVRRHGKTPIQWAAEIGVLGPRMTLGHAIFVDQHSWLGWNGADDLGLLVESSTNVAHCPTPFSRYGQALEDFGRYRRAGVNLVLGTDCCPHNLLEEMRTAMTLSRVSSRDGESVKTHQLLEAATTAAAKALERSDLGRLEPGCQADILMVDVQHHSMRPLRDPLRSLVYHAADRAVKDVYVGGEKVVEDGRVLSIDLDNALVALEKAQKRMEAGVAHFDYAGRTASQISAPTLPVKR